MIYGTVKKSSCTITCILETHFKNILKYMLYKMGKYHKINVQILSTDNFWKARNFKYYFSYRHSNFSF